MKKFRLTAANYYSTEANQAYFSASQIKSFCSCEARALAEINGEYVRPETTALLVGYQYSNYKNLTFPNQMSHNC